MAINKRFFFFFSVGKVTGVNDWVKNPYSTQLVNDSSLPSILMCVRCPCPATFLFTQGSLPDVIIMSMRALTVSEIKMCPIVNGTL